MKFSYKFSNLLGTVYVKGNVLFSPDGNSVISPVGNKITIFNLKNNKSETLSIESQFNYTAIDISPNGCLMVAVNEKGEAQMISMISHTVVYTYKLNQAASCVRFSPNGAYFAIAKNNIVFIFKTPGEINGEYNRFILQRYFYASHDDVNWIDWSTDSKILAAGSKDNSVKIYALDFYQNFRPYLLGNHTDAVIGCFFEENSLDINTISKNGQLCIWQCNTNPDELIPMKQQPVEPIKKRRKNSSDAEDEINENEMSETNAEISKRLDDSSQLELENEPKQESESSDKPSLFGYTRLARHYLLNEIQKKDKRATLTAASYHKKTKLLITAYSTGAFYLHELPDVSLIHSLSISEYAIETVAFNSTGDWITLGATGLGQLLVWEWQSEQYIMKQQGHSGRMNCMSYCPDGQYVATGGDDGKIKLWNLNNGYCFVTFHEHSSSVTDVQFSRNKKFLVSSSIDGTARAYDITRYRNFRTFTTPTPVQFSNVAIDYSGEFIAAGGQDVFEIYLWSMKQGRLLEILSGHEGPVVSLVFSPLATSTTLISGSWDKNIKIWNCLESSSSHDNIDVMSDVMAIAFKPNGEEVAVATLNGHIQFFNVITSDQTGLIEGRADLGQAISETDLISAKKNSENKCFTSITYSADGLTILAGGKSKFVCIYNIKDGILLKKFEITQNRSLDGLQEYISHRNVTEFGNMALIEQREEGNIHINLPGVKKKDMASRNFKPEIRVFSVRFSPTAQSWAAATTEGLLIFSLNKGIVFDPFNLTMEITTKSIRNKIAAKEYSTALLMALKLGETILIQEVIEQIDFKDIELVVKTLPDDYAHRTLQFVTKQLATSHHVEFYLKWISSILSIHGPNDQVLANYSLLKLQENLTQKYDNLSKVCDCNKYMLEILTKTQKINIK